MSRRRKQRRISSSSPSSPRLSNEEAAKVGPSPKKERGSWVGWLAKGAVLLVGVLLVALLVGFLWVRSYLRSEDFRRDLGSQIGAAVGGRAEVGPVDWHGTAMEVEDLRIESAQAGDWLLRDVASEVDLSKFWDKVWLVPQIEVRQARSSWDFRRKDGEAAQDGAALSRSGENRKAIARKSNRFLPNETEIRVVEVLDYEGEVRTEEGDYSWDGVRLRTEPNRQQATLVELEGGRLQTPFEWLGSLKLDTGVMTLREGEVRVEQSEWTADAGPLSFRGDLVGRDRSFEVSIEEWALQPLLPLDWGEHLAGRITGEAVAAGSLLSGEFEVEGGTVEGLPFLHRLAAYAGSPRMRRLSFEQARASFEKREGTWQVTEILLFDEGLLRVEGDFFHRPEGPSGQFQLGVPPGLLAHIPGAEEKVFLPGKGGLLWAEVRLSGTWENPQEDLSARLIQAAGERMLEMVPETGQWVLRYGSQALDQGTATLLANQGVILEEGTQVAEETLKQGGEVVEEGLKTGFGILNDLLGGEE